MRASPCIMPVNTAAGGRHDNLQLGIRQSEHRSRLLMCEARAADLRHSMADQNNSLAPSSKTEAAGRR